MKLRTSPQVPLCVGAMHSIMCHVYMPATAIIDIVNRQTVMKILVGDPHQQIYSFRGATNAMMQIQADATYYLSQVLEVLKLCVEI